MSWSNTKVIVGSLLNLGGPDLVIIGLVMLLLWGARKLAPFGESLASFVSHRGLTFEERLSIVSIILLLFAAFMWTALLLKAYE